jgi:methionyl-tRNA formyltransferase
MEPIIFAGTPENAARCLRALVAAGQHVALVITRQDAPYGRKRELRSSPVAAAALELAIPVLKTNRITPEDELQIASSGARLAVVVAFGALLKRSTIEALELGWFNLHYSVLPRWRGAAPVQSAILAGEKTTGVTLFKIDEGLDTGPVVGVVETVIEETENSERLLSRLTDIGTSLLLAELPRLFSGLATFVEQIGEPSFAPKLDRAMAKLELDAGAKAAMRQIRALNPEPGAWLLFNAQPLRVIEARPSYDLVALGELVASKTGVLLGFGDSSIELRMVQPAGKSQMPAVDWFRGTKPTERNVT